MIKEEAMMLGPHRSIAGVLTPAADGGDVAVLLLNAGLIHHAGPHRLYVRLARRLAAAGISAVRFDLSGIGDSPARTDNLPIFEMVVQEPREVMDSLEPLGFRRFILMGICSGAYGAFKTALADPRVTGAVLINPQDFGGDSSDESHAWAQRYWKRSILRPRAWLNLFTGRINYGRLWRTLAKQVSGGNRKAEALTAGVKQEMDRLTSNSQVKLLFVMSEQDVSVEYLSLLLGGNMHAMQASGNLRSVLIPGADHLFTRLADQQRLIDEILTWTQQATAKVN